MYSTRCLLILLLSLTEVYTQVCVTYNFEDGFEELFTYDRDVCSGQDPWSLSFYSDVGITQPHPRSETFLSASSVQQSCVSSAATFTLDTGGTLEVNAMIESSSGTSFITALVQGEDGGVLGQGQLLSNDAAPISTADGVYTIDITWVSSGTYDAYITLMGFASEGSLVLIDSYRYIPPGENSEACIIYAEDTEETVTEETITEATEGGTEIVTEGVTEIVTEGVTDIVTETTTESVTEDVTEGVTEEVTEGTTDMITEGITESTTDSITESVTEGVTEEVTEGVTEESVTDAVTDDTDTEGVTDESVTEIITTEAVTEDGVTAESVTEGTTDGEDTDIGVTNPLEIVTESPNNDKRPFWNALTITAVTILCLIALCLICWCFYECGKRNSTDDLPPAVLFEDPDYLPKAYTVPRVTRVFSDSNYNGQLTNNY